MDTINSTAKDDALLAKIRCLSGQEIEYLRILWGTTAESDKTASVKFGWLTSLAGYTIPVLVAAAFGLALWDRAWEPLANFAAVFLWITTLASILAIGVITLTCSLAGGDNVGAGKRQEFLSRAAVNILCEPSALKKLVRRLPQFAAMILAVAAGYLVTGAFALLGWLATAMLLRARRHMIVGVIRRCMRESPFPGHTRYGPVVDVASV